MTGFPLPLPLPLFVKPSLPVGRARADSPAIGKPRSIIASEQRSTKVASEKLSTKVAKKSARLIYCDHVERDGEAVFRLACKKDLEGIVAKHKYGLYLAEQAQWLNTRNQSCSQWAGSETFFERESGSNAAFGYWDTCLPACPE